MSLARLMLRSLRHYWRSNIAVVLGAAVAVAVLVGSLIVGDSVKGSLRALALERLGRTRWAITTPSFFRQKLADGYRAHDTASAVLLDATARQAEGGAPLPRVNVIGVDSSFPKLFATTGPPEPLDLAGRRVVVNAVLARDLGVEVGDAVLVTFGRRGAAPVHSLFGRRDAEHTVSSLRVVVERIIPTRGLGRFSLRNDEPRPRNLYVSLSWLQGRLDRAGQINTILLDGTPYLRMAPTRIGREGPLVTDIRLEDVGLRAVDDPGRGIVSIQSRRLVLPGSLVARLDRLYRPGITSVYLANTIAVVRDGKTERSLPYAVVAGLDPTAPPPIGPLPMVDGNAPPQLSEGDILLNAWAADDLGARVGDTIELVYFQADDQGRLTTAHRRFTLRGVVAMKGLAIDPALVPEFEGITDATTMGEWDPPFPIERQRIRPKDEVYWRDHRATPKAFVALPVIADMWLGQDSVLRERKGYLPKEGWVTSVRLPRAAIPRAGQPGAIDRYFLVDFPLQLSLQELGLELRPVRKEALRAAEGSTDFGVLFLSMSFFLVAAAAGLIFLLLRLTAERRAGQFGILLAIGFTPKQAARVLVGEGAILAAVGAALGAPLGVAYAAGIIHALETWWTGAVGEFTFGLHVRAATLVIGAVSGLLVALLALWWSARMLRKARALTLLAGWQAMAAEPSRRARRITAIVCVVSFAAVAALLLLSVAFHVVPPTGAFFGIGAAGLILLLALACQWLQRPAQAARRAPSLARLALRESSRHWLRSLLTVGLIAAASFLVVTVAANRRDLSRLDTRERGSGAGGFALLARSDVPIHQDLNDAQGRDALGFSDEASRALEGALVIPMRLSQGDDVSCLNMTRPGTPRVLGVPRELIERGGFTFARHLPLPQSEGTPWRLLDQELSGGVGAVVPAFADAASAQWILKIGLGDEIEVPAARGGKVRLRLVGLLAASIFQSELLISEANFRRHFGSETGYRAFLIATPPANEQGIVRAFRQGLGELSFDVQRTADILAVFARVQNTYLSTFETLGGLGLVLGTFGMVAVLLRSVLERRNELAMMLALGFRRRAIFAKIVMENVVLLLLGVAIGAVAALVAVLPHLLSAVADVQWLLLGATLSACVLVGILACALAAAAAMRGNLLAALRSE